MGKDLRRSERVNREIAGVTEEKKTIIIENISRKGGFLKNYRKKGPFTLKLLLNNYRSIDLKCESRWDNEQGFGFEIISIEKSKEKLYEEFVDRQIQLTKKFGTDRVFRHELFISLGETNATGNVYFANFVKFQGVLREKCVVHHIPAINEIMIQTGIRLVTVDTYQKFKQNAYFGDTIIGELTIAEIMGSQAKLKFRYKRKTDGVLMGEGYQHFCCVDKNGKVMKLPKLFDFLEYYVEV